MDRFLQDWPIKQIKVNIKNCPGELYCRGDFQYNEKMFAVVGTRMCSDYGKESAFAISQDLSKAGLTIVSGMALGIDTIAHQATLETNGKTIAVLGTGLDEKVFYPQENLKLSRQVLEKGGCLISEYPPDTKGALYTFPRRNRIIAGLSLGLLVVEAKIKSGALITAKFAGQYKKPVFALPGSIYSQSSKGPHLLIKQGAKLIENANDILQALGIEALKDNQQLFNSTQEQAVITALSEGALHIDKIIEITKLPASEIASAITIMEIDNKVRNLGNNTYAINYR